MRISKIYLVVSQKDRIRVINQATRKSRSLSVPQRWSILGLRFPRFNQIENQEVIYQVSLQISCYLRWQWQRMSLYSCVDDLVPRRLPILLQNHQRPVTMLSIWKINPRPRISPRWILPLRLPNSQTINRVPRKSTSHPMHKTYWLYLLRPVRWKIFLLHLTRTPLKVLKQSS